ncbi:MAG: efflux RND transporter periplasmic adaptor subunit [Bacteroidales bacterium]|nr:efflux RND transporter periplasmic adaptor subunit [Bacteroidales bacterium]
MKNTTGRMKRVYFWISGTAGLLLVLFFVFGFHKPREDAQGAQSPGRPQIKVDAFVVQPSVLIDEISVSGSLLAFEEVELKNEVAGRIVKINLPEGEFVKEGALLVKIFDDDLQAGLHKLEAQLEIQKQILQRQSELLKVNGISLNDYEQTVLQIKSLEADIEVEKARIRKTEVLAPFDGVIGLRYVSVGAQVTPSTLLATIRTDSRLKLDFSVPEKYSPVIKPGMKVTFTMYNDDMPHDATVVATERGIDAATRNLRVRAVVGSHSGLLTPGAFANVNLRLNEDTAALMIPTEAIIPREQSKSVIVARNGKARFTPVKTGIRQASLIEVTEGINPGDTVITTGILFLREGAKLSYSTVKTGPL